MRNILVQASSPLFSEFAAMLKDPDFSLFKHDFSFVDGDYVVLNDAGVRMEKGAAILEVEMPGCGPEDVRVSVQGNELSAVWNSKRKQDQFVRTLTLGNRADKDGITASLEHGLLTVRVPVKEKPKAREIKVIGAKAD